MYIPKHFDANEPDKIADFLSRNDFGELICSVDGKPFATHMPFLYDQESKTLLLHIARGNPQWKSIEGLEVLFIVNGPHGYISPSWYAEPGVPTWNYQALHFSGKATTFTDPTRLKFVVDQLTQLAEAQFPAPWQPDFPETMLRGIVGIEVAVSDIQCKFKLSQNRSALDQLQSIQELEALGNNDLARAMKKETSPE